MGLMVRIITITVGHMKDKFKKLYTRIAVDVSKMSYCKRLQVGAVIVSGDIVTYGYNGTPSGAENVCEHIGVTKSNVLHAESNAISKIARSTISSEDASLFCTHAPCNECAKLIIQSGIKEVYYINDYRSQMGIDLLKDNNIKVEKVREQ